MSTQKATSVPSKRLAVSILSTDTSIVLNNILSWVGLVDGTTELTSADFGSRAFGVLRNTTNTQMELFEFDPTTIANYAVTIISRGLDYKGGTTANAGGVYNWNANETIVELGSHVPQLFEQYMDKTSDETVAGVKTFTSLPATTAGNPVAGNDLVNKTYADSLSNSTTNNYVVVGGKAGETVAAGNILYLKAADNRWWKASSAAAATAENVTLGIAQGAGTAGNAITSGVLLYGLDTHQTGLTADTLYYLSTGGGVSTSVGTKVVKLGFTTTTTALFFTPNFDRLPTKDIQDAFAGTSGTAPSSSNKFVDAGDVATSGASKILRLGSDGLVSDLLDKQGLAILAGETLAAGNAVTLLNDLFQESWSGGTGTKFGNNAVYQIADKFIPRTTVTSSSIKIYLEKSGAPVDNVTLEIQSDSSGSPSNTAITNGTSNNVSGAGLTTSPVLTTFTFASAFTLTAGTTYWLVHKRSGAQDASNYYATGYNAVADYGSFAQKTYNGATWSTVTNSPLYFQIVLASGNPSITAWKTDADVATLAGFTGFISSGGAAGASVTVQLNGVNSDQISLTAGLYYFVSGTAGGISTTVGTYGGAVGIALSTTAILIFTRPRQTHGTTTRDMTAASGVVTIAHNLGVKPRYVKITAMNYVGSSFTDSVGVYNGGTTSSISRAVEGATGSTIQSSSNILELGDDGGVFTANQAAILTFDSVNLILTFTKTGAPGASTASILWEAQT